MTATPIRRRAVPPARAAVQALAVCAAALAAAAPAAAAYPERPIRLVVPYAPGATTDALARLVGQSLQARLGQPVVVENRPGAGGTIGTDYAAKAPADGYTLLLGAVGPVSVGRALYPSLPYDPQRDLAGVGLVGSVPFILVAGKRGQRLASLPALLSAARAAPDTIAYGSAGNGTPQHIIGAMFAQASGVRLLHSPYKGSGPAINDLLGGQIALMFDSPVPLLPHIRAGSVVPLAQTGARRSASLPDVPTLAEQGMRGFDAAPWYGIMVPAAVPADIVVRLNRELDAVLAEPQVRQRLLALGVEAQALDVPAFRRFLAQAQARWTAAVTAANVRPD
ncbi:tripartite tricarboxylate transporter substrate binding protein [Cupriavidus sp. USMAHM13]|uniref:tripartite tricarboxylate transporter substrate binding protein n=1 Tax=Cupriavidus sp. USMAHM13 TaxID=1389192 RepID=UPI000B14CFF5|nr:tripartite tricarboxylate transporter substrate binding protein [Cupriavidus sp. USMAHM13]